MEKRRLFSIATPEQLKRILSKMLDEREFLSQYGIRALSQFHRGHPYEITIGGITHSVAYEPGESTTGVFGGNSNWRGPIWMPVNYHLTQALRRLHTYFGDEFKVECPTGSGRMCNLRVVADMITQRLINIFKRDENGRRPVLGDNAKFQNDPHWRDYVLFHEYFHGDTGRGLGASHQTGWTALVVSMISELEAEATEQHPTLTASAIARR
jgi:hypothetical protein